MMPHGLRRRVSARHPEAKAICDRCSFSFAHSDLKWQMKWAGGQLVNTKWLVCDACLDVPNEGNRSINLRPDPVPVRDPRPENLVLASTGGRMYLETADVLNQSVRIAMLLESGQPMFLEST